MAPPLLDLIKAFRRRMPDPPGLADIPPELLSTHGNIFSGHDVERAALLDYLVFLSHQGAVLNPDEVMQTLKVADFAPLSGEEGARFAHTTTSPHRLEPLLSLG